MKSEFLFSNMELEHESPINTFFNVLLIHAIKINIIKYFLDLVSSVAKTQASLLPNRFTETPFPGMDTSRLAGGHWTSY